MDILSSISRSIAMYESANWEAYLKQVIDDAKANAEKNKSGEWKRDDGEQVNELYMTRPNLVSINAENTDVFHAMAEAYAINNKQSVFDRQALFHTDSTEVREKSVDTTDM